VMDYLDWESSLTAEQVFASSENFSYPQHLSDGSIIYLTSLSNDNNRSVLVRRNGEKEQVITPASFHLQTQISEYGGKPFWVYDDYIVFANRDDQCLYLQTVSTIIAGRPLAPIIITPVSENASRRYTDVRFLNSQTALCISEQKSLDGHGANETYIGLIQVPGDDESLPESQLLEPIVLVKGADFYSNLIVDSDRETVAWVQWNHPNMPWDDVDLCVASLSAATESYQITNIETIDLSGISRGAKSICQLLFSDNGDLYFSADFSADHEGQPLTDDSVKNFWQIYCRQSKAGEIKRITSAQAEYGYPHWVYGDSRISQLDANQLLAIESRPQGDKIIALNLHDLSQQTVFDGHSTVQHLSSDGSGNCLFVNLPKSASPQLLSLQSLNNVNKIQESVNVQVIKTSKSPQFDVSIAEAVTFPTRDGSQAHGFFYPPCNQECQSQTSTTLVPPLLVMVHGGPTARAYGHFDLQKQFWTNRGFAILDVNHRGSSGYGRAFRDALYGNWGDMDADDIIDGIDYLLEQRKADPTRVCIRGKSAGGYAVLRALTEFPDRFKAGANYYGIGNLVTLASSTHKFEKYYCGQLLGEAFSSDDSIKRESLYYQRSPINKMGDLRSAMIVFQGLLDKVVPPRVAQELVEVLESQKQTYVYVEYPDEGHGFRQSDNNIDAWNKELGFYKQVLAYK